MANWNRNAPPHSKPFDRKVHYTPAELDALEERARGIHRMDWTDKVKLIQGNRDALRLRSVVEQLRDGLANCPNPDCSPFVTEAIETLFNYANDALKG